MISQLASKHADKCRFCWMCRHLCPVQLQTGKDGLFTRFFASDGQGATDSVAG